MPELIFECKNLEELRKLLGADKIEIITNEQFNKELKNNKIKQCQIQSQF